MPQDVPSPIIKEVFIMRFHVTIISFDSIHGEAAVQETRQLVGKKIQEIQQSGKLVPLGESPYPVV